MVRRHRGNGQPDEQRLVTMLIYATIHGRRSLVERIDEGLREPLATVATAFPDT